MAPSQFNSPSSSKSFVIKSFAAPLLGNLVHQLARKRIEHKDAMALAFMSQLLLNALDPLARQIDAELDAEEEAEYDERELLRIAEATPTRWRSKPPILQPRKKPLLHLNRRRTKRLLLIP